MAETTEISWCDHTFNGWIGCQKVSNGCSRCYAERMAVRFSWAKWGAGESRVLTSDANWRKPLTWNRQAVAAGERHRVFCASLADVFDGQIPQEWRERLWELIRQTPGLDWLLLTKRPHSIRRMLPKDWGEGYPNVWLGVSAEDQETLIYRWPVLAMVPTVVRFISYEPALGPISLFPASGGVLPDWVIGGGESGPGARNLDPAWFRQVRDYCHQYGIAYFHKQWGQYEVNPLYHYWGMNIQTVKELDPPSNGKGGALLDGRLWRDFPVARNPIEGQMSFNLTANEGIC